MAGNNQNGGNASQRRAAAAQNRATTQTSADAADQVTTPPAAPADTVALATPPVTEAPVTQTPVEQDVPSTLEENEEDTRHVTELKGLLRDLVPLVRAFGDNPEDFAPAGKKALQITRFVIQYPKLPVLNALLAFFEENVDGVCQPHILLKGSSTLSKNDERQVGFLFALFGDLARKQVIRVENSVAISVLKKTEIIAFYNRKITKILQDNKS